MKIEFHKNIFLAVTGLIFAGQLLIGRFYDDRLQFLDFNITYFSSAIYFLFVLISFMNLKKLHINTGIFLFLLFIVAELLFSTYHLLYYNFSFDYSVIKYSEFIFISVFISVIILFSDEDLIKKLAIGLFLLSFMVLIGGLFFSFQMRFQFNDDSRLAILGGGPIVFSRWIVTGIIFVLFYFKLNVWVKVGYFITGVFLILLSGSKAPFIALFISLFLFYFFRSFQKQKIVQYIVISSVILVMVGTSFIYMLENNMIPERYEQFTSREKFLNSSSVSDRLEYYPSSYQMILKNPFGVGLGNWGFHHNMNRNINVHIEEYPHSIILEIFSESGIIVGFIFILLLLFVLFKSIQTIIRLKQYNTKDYQDDVNLFIFYFLFFINYLINTNMSGDLSDSRFLFVAMAVLIKLTYRLNHKMMKSTEQTPVITLP